MVLPRGHCDRGSGSVIGLTDFEKVDDTDFYDAIRVHTAERRRDGVESID